MPYQIRSANYSSTTAYLEDASLQLLEITGGDFSSLMVILPNYLSCEYFKEILFRIYRENYPGKAALLLPKTTTSKQFIIEKLRATTNLGNENHRLIFKMAQITQEYFAGTYTIAESINIAAEILDIFWELKSRNISITEVESWQEHDIASFWLQTAEFLTFAFEKFDKILLSEKFEATNLLHADNYAIIGFDGDIGQYLGMLPPEPSIYFFLPPLISFDNKFTCGMNRKIQASYAIAASIDERNMLTETQHYPSNYNATYYKFNELLEETSFITSYVAENLDKNIAIITENTFIKDILSTEFTKRNLPYNSSFGQKYMEFEESYLFLKIAKFKEEQGSFTAFIDLITSPLLSGKKEAAPLIEYLNQQKNYYNNYKDIRLNEELSELYHNFFAILSDWLNYEDDRLANLLGKNYEIFLSLYSIFKCDSNVKNAEKFMNLFYDSTSVLEPMKIGLADYVNYITSIFSMRYTMPINREVRLYILHYEESLLIDADSFIFADFNEESVLRAPAHNIWLSNKILKKLNLINSADRFDLTSYIVASKTHNKDIIITRSEFKSGVFQQVCPIINFIENLKIIDLRSATTEIEESHQIAVSSQDLPLKLYPTNIELLLRDPYGFYVKHVLGLKKKFNILSKIENSDFGLITHELIEKITISPEYNNIDLINKLIAESMNQRGIDSSYMQIWQAPLAKILNKTKMLNQEVRSNKGKIYSEIEGGFNISLSSKNLSIRAIADRIELYEDRIVIADFKTGSPPSFADVKSSKSPQLMIEAMILIENGFPGVTFSEQDVELVFYKIKTKEPYIEKKSILVPLEDVKLHKEWMIELLRKYYENETIIFDKRYMPDFWKVNFDDYQHYRR